MLRQSRLNPELSSYKQVDRAQFFECTPLAPLGCKVKNYEKPHQKRTYAPRSLDECYLIPVVNHDRQ